MEGERTNLEDDGSTGRSLDIGLLADKQDDGGNGEDDGGDEEGDPVTVVTSDERSGDRSGGTQVDRGVEVHVDPLVRQGGADDDGLSGFQNLLPEFSSVLFSHQRGDVGFDSASAKTHDENGNDQATERSVGVFEGRRSGGTSKDRVTSPRRESDVNSYVRRDE